MKKKIIAFDLDDTLAVSKSPVSDEMGDLLVQLLDEYEVCIISGGAYKQFKIQVVDRLKASAEELTHLHLMPTCGTKYYRYDDLANKWVLRYENALTKEQKERTIKYLTEGAKKLGLWEEQPFGDIIEDRGSQITFSALGQQAPSELKYKWDPTGEKKAKLRDYVAERIRDLEARCGGTTSVDVTMVGVDKAYGMRSLIKELAVDKDDVLFLGDKLQEGGNDYPVKAMGVDTIEVTRWEDTALVLRGIIAVTE